MEDYKNHLKDLSEIRSLMEQSSKFLSLSGLSGISVGIIAILGVVFAKMMVPDLNFFDEALRSGEYGPRGNWQVNHFWILLVDAVAVLGLAVLAASFFSMRLAKKRGLPVFNKTAWHMVWNLLIPLGAGGLFALIQLYHGVFIWISATTLIFYGLALLNASKFTLKEIRWLGILEIALGLAAGIWIRYSLLLWTLGFGLLHILYGIIMYFRYEREGHPVENK